ncbi:hypothetical protein MYA83_26795 [Pseudomonas palleroniana]|uniref:hypothetical protein n=1 Tax=Pseudomonas palleroniana TaxID=191390 RepID=UPI003B00A969
MIRIDAIWLATEPMGVRAGIAWRPNHRGYEMQSHSFENGGCALVKAWISAWGATKQNAAKTFVRMNEGKAYPYTLFSLTQEPLLVWSD